jgi:hypothetical protein
MMLTRDDLSKIQLSKRPTVVFSGPPLPVELAADIARRTDTIFRSRPLHEGYAASEYGENLRIALGFPRQRGAYPQQSEAAIKAFQGSWGYVDAGRLSNAGALGEGSWCHPDGTVCLVEHQGRYPLAVEYFDEACCLVKAFPYLNMEIGLWADEPLVRRSPAAKHDPGDMGLAPVGYALDELPTSPWPAEISANVRPPTFGLYLFNDEVFALSGDDPALLCGDGGLTSTVEKTVRDFRLQQAALTRVSMFGNRAAPGLPDEAIAGWFVVARQLGLIGLPN